MSIVVPAPAQGGYVLSDYVFEVRLLLHDATGRMYSDQQVIWAVNKGRERVARDTCCVRFLQTNEQYGIETTPGTEVYNVYNFLPLGPVTVDILGVSMYWGNERVKLKYWPYNKFDAYLRIWTTYQALPAAFSRYTGNVYIGPVPNQVYAMDWDTALVPNEMFDDTTPEQLPIPFQNPVPFYAAYLLKQYEQSFGEAQNFEGQYLRQRSNSMATWQRRTFENSYPNW